MAKRMQMQRYRMIILRLPHCLCSFSIFKLCIIFVLLFIIITISPASRSDYRPKIQLILWFFNLNFQIIAEGLQCFFSLAQDVTHGRQRPGVYHFVIYVWLSIWDFDEFDKAFHLSAAIQKPKIAQILQCHCGISEHFPTLSGSFFSSISENKILFFFFFFQT